MILAVLAITVLVMLHKAKAHQRALDDSIQHGSHEPQYTMTRTQLRALKRSEKDWKS